MIKVRELAGYSKVLVGNIGGLSGGHLVIGQVHYVATRLPLKAKHIR